MRREGNEIFVSFVLCLVIEQLQESIKEKQRKRKRKKILLLFIFIFIFNVAFIFIFIFSTHLFGKCLSFFMWLFEC